MDYVASPTYVGLSGGRYTGTLFSISVPGNDFELYDNEANGGPVKARKGQNPTMVTAFPLPLGSTKP
jgi:hypothetical protein